LDPRLSPEENAKDERKSDEKEVRGKKRRNTDSSQEVVTMLLPAHTTDQMESV
jgi:hypothetical protein